MDGQARRAVVLLGARGSGKSVLARALLGGPGTAAPGGLVHGRTQRHAGWMLLGFVPAVGMSIVTATAAYVDGMWGRAHRRTRVARSRAASTLPVRSSAGVAVRDAASLTFARREVVALSALNERIDATPNPASAPDPDRIEVQR